MNLPKKLFSILALASVAALFAGCSREAKIARHRARADRYFQKQEYPKAEVEYMNTLRLAPKDAAAVRQLGFIYFEQGRGLQAYRALVEAKMRDPENPDIRYRLGSILAQERALTNARVEARFVLEKQPTNSAALFILSDSARLPAENAEMRREIEAFSAKNGESAEAHAALADIALREGDLPRAEDHLKKADALNSKSPAVNSGWAKLRIRQGNLIEADVFLKRAADASPWQSQHRLVWAAFKLRTGDIAAARRILQEITDKAPDYLPAWNILADIALAEKQFEECSRITAIVLKLDPNSYEARLLRGRMFVLQDQPEKAIEELTRLETIYPGTPGLKYHLAVAHLRSGYTSKAVISLDQALKLNPQFAEAVLLRAEIDLRGDNAANAIPPLEQLIKNQPEHLQGTILLATAYQKQTRWDDALRIYRDMSVRFPTNPAPWTFMGMVHRQKRDYPAARSAFEKSLAIAPTYFPAVERLVELDVIATNYVAAFQRCARAAELQTNSAAPFILEARVHGGRKDTKAKEAALLKGLERDPNSLDAYTLLAGLYVDAKDYERAIQRLDTIISRNPKSVAAWMQKGIIFQTRNEIAKAKEAYERALAINPSFWAALNNLAYLLAESPGQLDAAFEKASKARQAAPSDASVADTLGWVHLKRKNYVAARRLFLESAERLDVSEIHYHLGLAEYGLGDEQSTRRAFQRALAKGDLAPPMRDDIQVRLAILALDAGSAQPPQIAQLEAAVKRDPADYFAQLRLGTVYARQGNVEKAAVALTAASQAQPQAAAPLLALARLYEKRDLQRAMQFARDARKLDPANPSIALTFGSLALRTHDFTAALAALQEGIRAPDSTIEARYEMASAQYALGQVAQATSALQAISTGATDSRIKQRTEESLALIRGSTSPQSQKMGLAQTRLKAEPDDLFALYALAEIHEQENRIPEAVKQYEKMVGLSAAFWPARLRLAYLYAERLNDDKAAQAHATAARQQAPDDPLLAQVLGKMALRKGDFQAALRHFQEASRMDSANGEPYYLMGLANYKLKRTNDSRLAMTKALALPLSPESSREAKRIMTETR